MPFLPIIYCTLRIGTGAADGGVYPLLPRQLYRSSRRWPWCAQHSLRHLSSRRIRLFIRSSLLRLRREGSSLCRGTSHVHQTLARDGSDGTYQGVSVMNRLQYIVMIFFLL